MLKNWLQCFYQDTVMSGLCGKANIQEVKRKVWVRMGAVILTHISTSLNNLLFTHVKSGLFKDVLV